MGHAENVVVLGKEAIAEKLSEGTIKTAHAKKVVKDLFALLEKQGQAGYIGEAISQLEHSLQAADSARRSGKSIR